MASFASRFLSWIVWPSLLSLFSVEQCWLDETGISLWWGFRIPSMNCFAAAPEILTRYWLFSDVLVGFWLTYAATFLGLISTVSVPDFLRGR